MTKLTEDVYLEEDNGALRVNSVSGGLLCILRPARVGDPRKGESLFTTIPDATITIAQEIGSGGLTFSIPMKED